MRKRNVKGKSIIKKPRWDMGNAAHLPILIGDEGDEKRYRRYREKTAKKKTTKK